MQVFLTSSKLLMSVRWIVAHVLINLNLKILSKVIYWMQVKVLEDNQIKV